MRPEIYIRIGMFLEAEFGTKLGVAPFIIILDKPVRVYHITHTEEDDRPIHEQWTEPHPYTKYSVEGVELALYRTNCGINLLCGYNQKANTFVLHVVA